MEQRNLDTCADCGADKPEMHNSRTHIGLMGQLNTKRSPGYLCVECWKLANPLLWPSEYVRKRRKPTNPTWIVWALFAVVIVTAIVTQIIID